MVKGKGRRRTWDLSVHRCEQEPLLLWRNVSDMEHGTLEM